MGEMMGDIRVVKIQMNEKVGYSFNQLGHYYERADDLQAVMGMVESHLLDSNGDMLCLSTEMMDEDEFNSLPEFTGF
jgi:hypothetical protein